MKYNVLTTFPEMINSGFSESILKRAVQSGALSVNAVNIRDYADNKHNKTDDYTYGGGAGMLMYAEPIYLAHEELCKNAGKKLRTIYLTPTGKVFDNQMAMDFAKEDELVFLCGHYEGIDERVIEEVVTDNVSIGDYVLTGGELPALVLMDAISRFIPGVLNNNESAYTDSFSNCLLEYPQYTRPEVWRGKKVPKILLSGDHAKVEQWRLEQSIARTKERRPDLYVKYLESLQEQ